MATDLSITRIGMAEHAYPAPKRRILAMHNSEQRKDCPVASGRKTVATQVKTYRIQPDGSRRLYEAGTVSKAKVPTLQEQRVQRDQAIIAASGNAQFDSWAHKV